MKHSPHTPSPPGVESRRYTAVILLAVNINLVAFSSFLNDIVGQVYALFVLTQTGRHRDFFVPPAEEIDTTNNGRASLRRTAGSGALLVLALAAVVGLAKVESHPIEDLVDGLVRDRGAEVTFISTCQGAPEYWADDSSVAAARLSFRFGGTLTSPLGLKAWSTPSQSPQRR